MTAGKPKKKFTTFKVEWLSEHINTGEVRLMKLGHLFFFCCKMCSEAKEQGQFSEEKVWIDRKLDYLKRHVVTKGHLHAVDIVQTHSRGLGLNRKDNGDTEELRPKFNVFIFFILYCHLFICLT